MPEERAVPSFARALSESAAKCLLRMPLHQDFQDFFRELEIPGQRKLDMGELSQKIEGFLEKIKKDLLGESSSSSQSSSQAQSRSTSSQPPSSSSSQSSSREELPPPPPLEGIVRCIINRLYYAFHNFVACHPILWSSPGNDQSSPPEPTNFPRETYKQRGKYDYPSYNTILNVFPKKAASSFPNLTRRYVRKWVESLYGLRADADYQPEIVFYKRELKWAFICYYHLYRVMTELSG